MKVKTSITLSEDTLDSLDQMSKGFKNRSDLIEQALQQFIASSKKKKREESDLKILNQNSKRLNEEAEDVLGYQVTW
ncbi:MAG: ribbon-helix-helix protein, CopG family [Deltaproteobacteria bacterium]|nr:ribbon-helix-helix protein, CopG family [Deltaproteobacteria bacterium]